MQPTIVTNPLYSTNTSMYNAVNKGLNRPTKLRRGPINLSRGRRNLFNPNSRNTLLKTGPVYKNKKIRFSNGSEPGQNFNMTLPRSTISATSIGIPGANIVPPVNIRNANNKGYANRGLTVINTTNRNNIPEQLTKKKYLEQKHYRKFLEKIRSPLLKKTRRSRR